MLAATLYASCHDFGIDKKEIFNTHADDCPVIYMYIAIGEAAGLAWVRGIGTYCYPKAAHTVVLQHVGKR